MDKLIVADVNATVRSTWFVGGEVYDITYRWGAYCRCDVPHLGHRSWQGNTLLVKDIDEETATVEALCWGVSAPNVRNTYV